MKFTHNGKSLFHIFSILNSIIPPVATRPILQSAKLTITEDQLICSATDLEVGIEMKEAVDHVDQTGECLIPVSQLASVLREYQNDPVTIELADNVINVTAKGEKYHFFVNVEDQFPDIPFGNYADTITIGQDLYKSLIDKVIYAVSNDPTKIILGGVMAEAKGGTLKLAAADGHRMAFVEHGVDTDSFARAIIPRKTLKILSKTLSGDGDIKIGRDENHIYFVAEGMVLVSRLIEGNFPDVESFIPNKFNATLSVDKKTLADVLKKSLLVSADRDQSILFKVKDNRMHVSTYLASNGGADFDVNVEFSGDPLDIVFNPRFVQDVLDSLEKDQVTFSLISDEERVMIKEGKLKSIVMPIAKQK